MRANGFRCRLLLAGAVGLLTALGSACDLNPQPQPPGSSGSGAYTPAEPAVGADGGGGGASSGGTLVLGDGGTPLFPPPFKSDAGAGDAAFGPDATAAGDAQESGSSPDASAVDGDAAGDGDAALEDGPCQESGE